MTNHCEQHHNVIGCFDIPNAELLCLTCGKLYGILGEYVGELSPERTAEIREEYESESK